jgi:hypothetical protein
VRMLPVDLVCGLAQPGISSSAPRLTNMVRRLDSGGPVLKQTWAAKRIGSPQAPQPGIDNITAAL